MPFIPREEALKRLRGQVAAGRPILGCGAGTGISAKFAERGGADLTIIYNSGRYRMAGRGSLAGLMPYGDANAIVVEMAGGAGGVNLRAHGGVSLDPQHGQADDAAAGHLLPDGRREGPARHPRREDPAARPAGIGQHCPLSYWGA